MTVDGFSVVDVLSITVEELSVDTDEASVDAVDELVASDEVPVEVIVVSVDVYSVDGSSVVGALVVKFSSGIDGLKGACPNIQFALVGSSQQFSLLFQ